MKIVHICLCGPVTDGLSYQDNLLSKYHKKMGHDVSFITSKWIYNNSGEIIRFENSNYYNEDNVLMIRLNNKETETFNTKLKHFYGLYENLVNIEPDIIFVHGVQFLQMREVVKYAKKNKKVKIFVDNHADFSNSARNKLSKYILHGIIWKHMAKMIEPYTTKFYGVLPARVDFLIDIYKLPADKCELLVMGADDELIEKYSNPEIKKNERRKLSIKDDDFLIVTGGKIDKAKLQTLFLMKAVKDIDNQKVKLIIFGSVEKEIKAEFDKLCDGEKIQYLGWVNSDESYKYFAIADLVVFPGRHSVYWEQVVAMKIPMICKYWEGTTHIDIGGNVIFLYEDSVDEISEAIKKCINEYTQLKINAEHLKSQEFLYRTIAVKSIQY